MQEIRSAGVGDATALIDSLIAQQKILNAAQAKQAGLMLDFADRRRGLDRARIAEMSAPGQLADRSALVPAGLIRELAEQSGTLFHRLLTDEIGNLLDVTELGRFPSRKLGLAVGYRTPTCANPTCEVPAHRSDLDHIVPAPRGPTSAKNLEPKCRGDHRAKTHAGHLAQRLDTTSYWTTPTGHTYSNHDDPLPVENWPGSKNERAG